MNAGNQPTISVCIPVYNCEQYVSYAIESVLAQTFDDFELVLLNNASTDRTLKILQQYSDPRIRIINNDANIGASGNWNKALAVARGKYIKILCADDLLYPLCLDKQVAVFEDPVNSAVSMVCCGRDVIDEQGHRKYRRSFPGLRSRVSGRLAVQRTIRAGANLLGEPSAVLFRSEIIARTGGFDGGMNYVIDLDLWCRILAEGDLYIVREALCAFRVSSKAWSTTTSRLQGSDYRALIDKLRRDPRFHLSALDAAAGRTMSLVNMLLRRMFYAIVLRKVQDKNIC
jgi:glycosyltransferase involved in cell wall biosynthesis